METEPSWKTTRGGGGGGLHYGNRRGCSSEMLNLTPKGDQSGRALSKIWPLKETAKKEKKEEKREFDFLFLFA